MDPQTKQPIYTNHPHQLKPYTVYSCFFEASRLIAVMCWIKWLIGCGLLRRGLIGLLGSLSDCSINGVIG